MRSTLLLTTTMVVMPAIAEDVVTFNDHVRPILQQSCFNCHNPDKAKGGLDLTKYNTLLAGAA